MTSPLENQNLSLIPQALEFLIEKECHEIACCLEQLECTPLEEAETDTEIYHAWLTRSNEILERLEKIKKIKKILAEHDEILPQVVHMEKLNMPIEKANISVRGCNALSLAGMHTVYDVIKAGPNAVLLLHNIGKLTFDEICHILIEQFDQSPERWNYKNARQGGE